MTMEAIIQSQQIIAEGIQKLLTNFKKDSASRKTADYLKKRLEALQNLWGEFESNHETLLTSRDKTDDYFTANAYDKVKQRYDMTLEVLQKTKPSTVEDRGVLSKSDELLSHQNTNFRAFTRVVRNIYIDELNEKWEIEDKLQVLQLRWKIIDETHWQIDNAMVATNLEYEREFSDHESTYERTKRELNRKLNSTSSQYQSVPQIEIPNFSGNYSQWPTFMDLYSEAIHNNNRLTKTQKLQHLKGKLRGEAERLVQHLTVSAENYDACWEILTRRYNNIQLLFTKQIQIFLNQPAVQKQSCYELKRLHDVSLETIHAINNLGVDTTTWDPIIVHILTEKLDPETYAAYMEIRKAPRNLPSFDELISFLENKFTALEPLNKKNKTSSGSKPNNHAPSKEFSSKVLPQVPRSKAWPKTYHASAERICPICNKDHLLIYCSTFHNMNTSEKSRAIAKVDAMCRNCLFSHNGRQCNSNKRCKICNNTHHTILHELHETGQLGSMPANIPIAPNNRPTTSKQTVNHVAANNEILLATVQLKIRAADGNFIQLRCLLDQGSQINLITEAATQRLGLHRFHQKATVSGIGISANQSHGTVQLVCESLYGDYGFTIEAMVMSKMLNNLPNYTFTKQQWPHLHNINLADPEYNISGPVDILLDAGVYADIILDGILRGSATAPIAQQTKIGWVLLGKMRTYNCNAVLNNIDEISQFWEIEEITENKLTLTTEHERCETFFQQTTKRLPSGRYEVRIPMKPNFEEKLGASKPQAVAQFKQLEKRLENNNLLKESYKQFINEYITLGHMKECKVQQELSCVLPHHGVVKMDSATTKLRVVYNASAKTKSGHSLNQLMECGPNLQQDLQTLILRWRTYQYVYTADIEKFFRQVFINETDQHLQKIVWRDSNTEPIKEYQLCTITYGTKAAPFLAMRTIKQLVQDDGSQYPLAANILSNQLYMDDILGGSCSISEAKMAQKQLIEILHRGGFNLRKWASNEPSLLEQLPQDLVNQNMLDFERAETNKTLGITWNPRTDQFTFKQTANIHKRHDVITKRILLSELSKIFDPLGWLAPVTMKAKLMFQNVWISKINWDEAIPNNIQKEWDLFQQDIEHIKNISIPRWIGNQQHTTEIHGFSDASEKGYAAVIYCKSTNNSSQPIIRLLAGKTKLAPQKKPTSLPRLELCGALLLSRLMKKIIETTSMQTANIYGWTDSMVVLGWLQGDPSRWKTFVSNRVVEITAIMPASCWRHVKSEDNAADCASRGVLPSQLPNHSLWWEGPTWLKENNLPPHDTYTTSEDRKQKQVCLLQRTATIIEEITIKYNSISRINRVLCWILRFIHNTRDRTNAKRISHLTTAELEIARNEVVKFVQNSCFGEDISQLQNGKNIRSTSSILNLNPMLDEHGILRVRGRLNNSALNYAQKHPIILPNKHKVTELIISRAHIETLHGGARLTLSHLRCKYWILGGIRTVKKHITQCVKCHRFRTMSHHQQMADLPSPRVTPSRPFMHTGVDFTGQVEVKTNKGRGVKTTKGYVAIFVCLATKAIHLELVSDLSTDAFLAALKRLCARRGTPRSMYSDNGTNFVGAAKVLTKEHRDAIQCYVDSDLLNNISEWGIEWNFNAPAWPTAGGLWEAAVRSMKHHLKRVLGEQRLTFEEFTTLLTQIEACLNSRPLISITDDVDDLDCLTPGHFLVGGPLLAPPLSPEVENRSLTSRWKMTEKMHRDFWKRWSVDYLQTLQTRSKWHYHTKNLEVNDVVLIKEDNTPPAKWLLGKITETHPGSDGRVRVATVKTKNSHLKRPVTKLARLPIENEESDSASSNKTKHLKVNDPAEVTTKRTSRSIRGKKTFNSYICSTLFLITTLLTPSLQQMINVTTLNPAKLIYFDKISDMQIVQDHWNLVVYYNMSSYWQSLSTLENYINHLNNMCKGETAFQTIAVQFEHELTELKHFNGILRSEHGRRAKRGLIDGVGYIANSLFGVLDARFADKYNHDIKQIQNNEQHLLTLYKEHTSIIEGEYNLLKRNEQVMNKQLNIITQHLNESEQRITRDQNNAMYITATALAINVVLSNLHRVQQQLLDVVTEVRNGRIDTHLLSPEELQEQLNIISGQLPHELSLPCVNSPDCIRNMYKLPRVSVRVTETYLIFEVKLPLISNERYEINRIIPIPQTDGRMVRTIVPTSEYLAVNIRKDLLITINAQDMKSCVQSTEKQLICTLNKPIYDIKAALICEAEIINNRKISSCRISLSECRRHEWIELHSRGAWLYYCCEECSARIFCPAGAMTKTLHHTGVITLSDGCILKNDDVIIHSQYNFHSQLKTDGEQINIPNIESEVNHVLNDVNITFFPENHEEPLKVLKEKIDHVKAQQETLNDQIDGQETHHYIAYGLFTVVIVSISVWAYYKIKKQRSSQGGLVPTTSGPADPEPLPRGSVLGSPSTVEEHNTTETSQPTEHFVSFKNKASSPIISPY